MKTYILMLCLFPNIAFAAGQVFTKEDINDIALTYKQNEMRFVKLYKGKIFKDTLRMEKLAHVMGWTLYFDAGDRRGVYCKLTDAQAEELSYLNVGDNLLLTGKIDDVNSMFHSELVLGNCKILKQ